jgi:acetyl-CoA acetyltransferase
MGQTSEEVAKRFHITREDQDRFAVGSHIKAAAAQSNGYFSNEITVISLDGVTVSADEGIRPDTSFIGLQKLKPAFSADGSTTAGNSSQVTHA